MKTILNSILIFTSILFLSFSCCKESDEGMECIENIDEDCACTQQYDPVCGCNDKTYGNSCEAACAGIVDYTPGACE